MHFWDERFDITGTIKEPIFLEIIRHYRE
jgi:hypothetical protein